MKATAGRSQSVGRAATPGRAQPVEQGHVSLTSSLLLSLVLHGALVLWLLGSAWLLSRSQPYRLVPQTVFLVGDIGDGRPATEGKMSAGGSKRPA